MKFSPAIEILAHNPLIIVSPIVLILLFSWQRYAGFGKSISEVAPQSNLFLAASDIAEPASSVSWTAAHSGVAVESLSSGGGYVHLRAPKLVVSSYKNGDITLTTPVAAVTPGQTYLFKTYVTTDAPFVLLRRYVYQDQSSDLAQVGKYDAEKGVWTTASDAFSGGDHVRSVQYVISLASKGSLTVDGAYLAAANDVFIAPEQSGVNEISNSGLSASAENVPDDWSTFHAGNNTAAFSYGSSHDGKYVQATVNRYRSGEAKWEYTAIPVRTDEYYDFSARYKSDAPVDVVAEFLLDSGKRQFFTLDTLQPAGGWTEVQYPVQVPQGGVEMTITLVLHGTGTVSAKDFKVVNTTKPGEPRWHRPLVSVTFDDGWQSSFDNAVPELNRYGYKATFYVNPASIETPNFMTAAELQQLQSAGNEIGAHGYQHKDMTTLASGRVQYQLQDGQAYLARAGFPAKDFATPYGKSDAVVDWYARKYYDSMRGTSTGINTRQNLDPYDLRVLYVENNTPPDLVRDALARTRQSDGWLILVYHRIGANARAVPPLTFESATISKQSIAKQLSLVHQSGITVETVQKALKEVSSQ